MHRADGSHERDGSNRRPRAPSLLCGDVRGSARRGQQKRLWLASLPEVTTPLRPPVLHSLAVLGSRQWADGVAGVADALPLRQPDFL